MGSGHEQQRHAPQRDADAAGDARAVALGRPTHRRGSDAAVPVVALFALVLGAIYAGWATPDEAAAVGVVGAAALLAYRRRFSWASVKGATIDSAKASAMIFLLLGAAGIFSKFLSVTGVIAKLTQTVMGLGLPFWGLRAT